MTLTTSHATTHVQRYYFSKYSPECSIHLRRRTHCLYTSRYHLILSCCVMLIAAVISSCGDSKRCPIRLCLNRWKYWKIEGRQIRETGVQLWRTLAPLPEERLSQQCARRHYPYVWWNARARGTSGRFFLSSWERARDHGGTPVLNHFMTCLNTFNLWFVYYGGLFFLIFIL